MYTVFCGQEAKKKHLAVLTGDRINEVFLEGKFSRFARRPIESGCEVTVRRGFTGTTVFLKKRNHFNLKFKSLKKPVFFKTLEWIETQYRTP